MLSETQAGDFKQIKPASNTDIFEIIFVASCSIHYTGLHLTLRIAFNGKKELTVALLQSSLCKTHE